MAEPTSTVAAGRARYLSTVSRDRLVWPTRARRSHSPRPGRSHRSPTRPAVRPHKSAASVKARTGSSHRNTMQARLDASGRYAVRPGHASVRSAWLEALEAFHQLGRSGDERLAQRLAGVAAPVTRQ